MYLLFCVVLKESLIFHEVIFQLSLAVAQFLLNVIKELQGMPYLAVKPLKLLRVGINAAFVCHFMELQLSGFHDEYLLLRLQNFSMEAKLGIY